jgi:hypothetical protein
MKSADKKLPKWAIGLMGSTGILLIISAIPVGITMLLQIHFKEHIEFRYIIIPVIELVAAILVLGIVLYCLCICFAKKAASNGIKQPSDS